MTDVKTSYPERYYASYDTKAIQPTPVTGWYDTWEMGSVSEVPPASEMIPVSEVDWNNTTTFRLPIGKGVNDGKIIDYTAPPTPIPLKTQAENELSWINQQAALASAMGETFTDEMKAYVKAIQAIATGADTSSTELPQRPSEGKVAAS